MAVIPGCTIVFPPRDSLCRYLLLLYSYGTESLALGNNTLMGSIPSEIALMSSMKELYLWGNKLSGSIPTELDFMTDLGEFGLCLAQYIELPIRIYLTSGMSFPPNYSMLCMTLQISLTYPRTN